MRRPAATRTSAGSRLFLRYALVSLVPVLALGLALVRGEQSSGVERGLAWGRAQAAVIEQMAVSPALGGAELTSGLTDRQVRQLQKATDLAVYSGSVTRLQVRSFSGQVLFSDDGLLTSSVPATARAFRAAADGHTDVAVVDESRLGLGRVIRVLEPVVPATTGEAVGVLELYLPYEPIATVVARQLHRTYLQLAVGLLALYLVLALVTWSTTRRLRRHAAEREHQAMHDPLTGLPNRERFRLVAEEALADRGGQGAVALVDLNRFKEVNDSLGHHSGDQLLRTVAERLRSAVRSGDTVARLGGDEFGLVLPDLTSDTEAQALLDRVRDEVAAPIDLAGVEVSVAASVGVVLYPQHGRDLEQLLQHADAAMYEGKRGTAGLVLYAGAPAADTAHWLLVESELRQALRSDELVLHYQPVIDLESSAVLGLEALLRWQHPRRGLLAPDAFLPAAEQSGLLEPVTAWVLDRALRDAAAWRSEGTNWDLWVNIAAGTLDSGDLANRIAGLLSATGAPLGSLHLDVPATALTADNVDALHALAALGVGLAIDDVGAGVTCLATLRRSPVREIKVDRSLVTSLATSEQDRAVVAALVALAHALGYVVTAEGVEDAAAISWLQSLGCDRARGPQFARPAAWQQFLPDAPRVLTTSSGKERP